MSLMKEVKKDGHGWMALGVPIAHVIKWYIDLRSFILKKWFKYTNKTQREALRILEYEYSTGKVERCPVCKSFATSYPLRMEDHISEEHGFPKDMVVAEYIRDVDIRPKVEKADTTYLKYL